MQIIRNIVQLNDKEIQFLNWPALNLLTKEIAEQMYLSPHYY